MFLVFALITLLGALAMFRQRNVVVAGLCMVLTFFGVAGLFVLLANPVAAALQIIVYSGAIMVLVLFVIMLLNSHEEEPAQSGRLVQAWGGALLAAVLGVGAVKLVLQSRTLHELGASPVPAPITLNKLGVQIFSEHLVAFEVVGLLLLAAMIAAVSIAKRKL
ncbi:MAG: NADH-quinone oxidoreductase subunit J [Acidobacteria bacterium]|nr:NADH-quinone oxidoreductase subunit J [Acidobacteriota bacterium]